MRCAAITRAGEHMTSKPVTLCCPSRGGSWVLQEYAGVFLA
jgi:hypothetical protein